MHGGVAVVVPGSGELPALAAAKAVALDVRALPDSEEGRAALDRALVAVVHGDLTLPDVEERTCNGQPDEVYSILASANDQYECTSGRTKGRKLEGTAATALPLVVLTAPTLTPLAAWAAVALRVRADAFIVGESVPAAIAESRWAGIGQAGLAVRTQRLLGAGAKSLPDVLAADLRTSDPLAALAQLDWSAPRTAPEGESTEATRPALVSNLRPKTWGARSDRVGDARAALVVAYAATRTFFPYFDDVGDVLDARLDEALALLAGGASQASQDRAVTRRALGRFSEALHDGHGYLYDKYTTPGPASPVALLPVGGDLVVAVSSTPDAKPGDVIVSIDGIPAAMRLEEAMRYVSGSKHAARTRAAATLVRPGKPVVLKSPDGATRTVTFAPNTGGLSTSGMFDRPAGTLDDLGAADVYYVTLDDSSKHAPTPATLAAVTSAMAGKRAVILDLRGYPGPPAWKVLAHVASPDSHGPKMAELLVTASVRAVDAFAPFQVLKDWAPGPQGYTGKVIVLTGADTQSQAEHWTSFFRSKNRGKVVGGATSGANGTITGVQLPGGYGLMFTGMVVRHADGTRFHAVGHVPDVQVEPSIEDLAAGRDTVLLRALSEL
jgi:hypothetical protein